jgi:hypothetical protein
MSVSGGSFLPLTKSASVQLGGRQAAHSDDILEPLASASYRNVLREKRESERCVQFVSRTLLRYGSTY